MVQAAAAAAEIERADLADQEPELLSEMGERLAADLDLLELIMLPGLGKRGEAGPDREEQAVILDR